MAEASFALLMGAALVCWGAAIVFWTRFVRAYWEWRELRDRSVGAAWHGPYVDRLVEFLSEPREGTGYAALRHDGRRAAFRMLAALAGCAACGIVAVGVGLATDLLVFMQSIAL